MEVMVTVTTISARRHYNVVPWLSLSPFTPAIPFPKEINKKLSYRGQNVLSVIKTRTQY